MKIAFVFDKMLYGGIERVGIDYINLLLMHGHKVDVYILTKKTEQIINEIPPECEVRIHPYSQMLCPEKYWYIAKRWWWGKYLFPVIFLALSFINIFLRIFKGISKKYDVGIAFSGHINDLTYITSYIKSDEKVCWLHGSLSGYLLMSPGYGFLYKKIKNLVVLSMDNQEDALISNKLDGCKIKKIYNPILVKNRVQDNLKIEKLKQKYGEFALMVGRFSPQKDHITVIDAVKLLRDNYNKHIKTVFVGDGPLREEVEKYAKDNGLSDLIFFEGTQKDVQNYYKAAKIFIHSSPAEGLPTVLLEAMSFGVPIVATDSRPGVREILGESEFGLICPVKDAEIMADKVYELLTNDQLYHSLVSKGLNRIKDFSPEVISKQLKKLLNEIGLEENE
jgi:glycosyltransferase involved in cell wall biosynthesis